VIVSDVRLYRDGMHASLASRPQFTVVGAVADMDHAVEIVASASPQIVILDMATRGSIAGARRLRDAAPAVHIVGFGVQEDEREILACAEAGLSGYVPSDASLDDLVARVDSVARGELLCTPRTAALLFRSLGRHAAAPEVQAPADLTAREREVLTLINRGLSNKEIAVRLRIEVSTVKNHVHNLLEKLQVTSRAQAARLAGPAARRAFTRGVPSSRD
jgi:DNA-binding NarL/FixJ family response regulator